MSLIDNYFLKVNLKKVPRTEYINLFSENLKLKKVLGPELIIERCCNIDFNKLVSTLFPDNLNINENVYYLYFNTNTYPCVWTVSYDFLITRCNLNIDDFKQKMIIKFEKNNRNEINKIFRVMIELFPIMYKNNINQIIKVEKRLNGNVVLFFYKK